MNNPNTGWHNDPIEHGLAAKGIKSGRKGPSKEEFQSMFPEYREGKPKEGMTEFLPQERICTECELRAQKGEASKYRYKARPDVIRKSMYHHGGLSALRSEYKCRTHREHGISPKTKEPGKNKIRAKMLQDW